jgi:hypothetical protein
MSKADSAVYLQGKRKVKANQTLRQKRNMAARLANFPLASNSSPKRKELFLRDWRNRKMRTAL